MADEVLFVAPNGKETRGANFEELRRLLLEKGPEYWEGGSGDAGLQFYSDGQELAEMILMVREPYGVFVQHLWVKDLKEYVVQRQNGTEEDVTIVHCGDPWTLPRKFFVSRDDALKALETFFGDGARDERVKWSEF
ncbi:MAG: Imm1 family immunity protein [bacterium]